MAVEHIRKEFDLFIATYKPQKETHYIPKTMKYFVKIRC